MRGASAIQCHYAAARRRTVESRNTGTTALIDSLAILFEKKRIVLPEAVIWPEAIDELESFEYSVSDAGNVKTSAPPGIHDDIVMALALATFMPGRFDPDVKPNPQALLSMLGRARKPRRASFRLG